MHTSRHPWVSGSIALVGETPLSFKDHLEPCRGLRELGVKGNKS